MRKVLVAATTLIILSLILFIYLRSTQMIRNVSNLSDIKIKPSEQACLNDDECTWAPVSCTCGCEYRIPINRKYKDKYDSLFSADKCGDDYSWDICEYCCTSVLKCIDEKCISVEAPEMCN